MPLAYVGILLGINSFLIRSFAMQMMNNPRMNNQRTRGGGVGINIYFKYETC